MIRPLELLKGQVEDLLSKASATSDRQVRLSENDFESFKSNFLQLCYEVQYGALDEVFQQLVNSKAGKAGYTYKERDLSNMLRILKEIKAAE